MDTFGVIILAAGRSVRMGKIKALLSYRSQVTFLEQIFRTYQQADITQSLVVVNNINYPAIKKLMDKTMINCPCIINAMHNSSRVDSIKVGLQALNDCSGIFIHDVDRPFINPELLVAMKNKFQPNNYVVPQFQSKSGHPVLISQPLKKELLNENMPSLTLKDFLMKFEKVSCEWGDNTIYLNINTTDQLNQNVNIK